MELQFLFSAYRLIMIHICITFGKNIKRFQLWSQNVFDIIYNKGHTSLNIIHGVKILFSAHHLIMVSICTKFRENILNGLRLWSVYNFSVIIKGHNSGKRVHRVIVLVLCILSDHGLHMYQV